MPGPQPLSIDAIPGIPLHRCSTCDGAGHNADLVREAGERSYETVCGRCEGLAVELALPDRDVTRLLLLALLRWPYTAEPERLRIPFGVFDEAQGLADLLRALQEEGGAL